MFKSFCLHYTKNIYIITTSAMPHMSVSREVIPSYTFREKPEVVLPEDISAEGIYVLNYLAQMMTAKMNCNVLVTTSSDGSIKYHTSIFMTGKDAKDYDFPYTKKKQ